MICMKMVLSRSIESSQVAAMVGVRKLLDFLFTQRELRILDDIMPESTRRKREEELEIKSKDKVVDPFFSFPSPILF